MEDIHQKLSILHKIINELTQKPINIQQNILFLEEEMTKVYECILPLITISNNKSIPSSSSSTTTIASKPNCMKPPPKPSVLLSITEFRIIYTIMDILWSFQYHCYLFLFLESSSTTTINTESHPKSLLLSETQYHSLISILKTESQPLPTTESEYILLLHRIRNISLCMERIILHDLFSGFMIERNIKRLLICLVFFESFPDPISNHHEHTMSTYYNFLSLSDENRNDENIDDNNTAISIHKKYRVLARERLLKICCDGNFKSVVVTGLKTLSRGPPWLRHSGGKWFSQLLMSSDGLEAVLFAYLQGVEQSEDPTKIQVAVAKLVTSLPTHLTKDEYYSALCPQMVVLIRVAVDSGDQVLLRVMSMIIARISYLAPESCATDVFRPLFNPLLMFHSSTHTTSIDNSDSSTTVGAVSERVVNSTSVNTQYSQTEVCHAVGALNAILTRIPPPPFLLTVLCDINILHSSLIAYLQLCLCLQTISTTSEYTGLESNSSIHATTTNASEVGQALNNALWESILVIFSHTSASDIAEWMYSFVVSIDSESKYNFVRRDDGSIEISDIAVDVEKEKSALSSHTKYATKDEDDFESIHNLIGSDISKLIHGLESVGDDDNDEEQIFQLSRLIHTLDQQTQPNLSTAASGINELSLLSESITQVTTRSILVCTILCELEKSITSIADQSTNKSKKVVSNNNEEEVENLQSTVLVATELFLLSLKSYLLNTSSSSNSDSDVDKRNAALLVLSLQNRVPIPALLRNGKSVILVLDLFLKSYLASLSIESKLEPMSSNTDLGLNLSADSVDRLLPTGLQFVQSTLGDNDNDDGDGDGGDDYSDNETVTLVLSLLSNIVEHGNKNRSADEESGLRSCLNTLSLLSVRASGSGVGQSAAQLARKLLQRNCADTKADTVITHYDILDHMNNISDKYSESTDPSERAFAVHLVTDLVLKLPSDQVLSDEELNTVIDYLVNCLSDIESFVFLAALHSLTTIAGSIRSRVRVVFVLTEIFGTGHKPTEESILKPPISTQKIIEVVNNESTAVKSKSSSTISKKQVFSWRVRTMIAESLCSIIRNSGESAPTLLPYIMQSCIKLAKSRPSAEDSKYLDSNVSLNQLKIINVVKEDEEVDSNITGIQEPNIPPSDYEFEAMNAHAIAAAAQSADFILCRQSSLSLLAEAMAMGGYSSMKYLSDALDIAIGILTMEQPIVKQSEFLSNQAKSSARKSAVFILRHIVFKLGERILRLDSAEAVAILRRIQTCLQIAQSDKDKVVKFQVELTLAALDELILEQAMVPINGSSSSRWDILSDSPKLRLP